MTTEKLAEFQCFLQMYDKGIVSAETVLEKMGVKYANELPKIKKEEKRWIREQLKFKKLHKDAIIPKYQTEGASGFDFHALVEGNDDLTRKVIVDPKDQVIIRTGLACSIPYGYEIQVRPKSGLSFKHKLTITNTPGTIDSDYTPPNEIKIIIYNLGDSPYVIENGQRIAQGVFCPVIQANIVEIEEISDEDVNRNRGGGFGSTGIK